MLPLTKTVAAGPAAARESEEVTRKKKLDRAFIGRRSLPVHPVASSAQHFNANRVNSFILFCFAYSDLFRMEELFSALPPRMEKQFSFANPISIYRVAAFRGRSRQN